MKEYYKIGEISKLYGIGTDSLRYYERLGILKPHRDSNGYRMYSVHNIHKLNILRELRTIGFSLEEIKEHLTDYDLEKTLRLFQKEIDTVEERIEELQQLKRKLSQRIHKISDLMKIPETTEELRILQLPERYVVHLNDRSIRDEELDFVIKKLQSEHENRLYLIGSGDIGARIQFDYIEKGGYGNFCSVFSFVEEGDEYDEVIPAGQYLCSTVRGSYRNLPAAWERIFDKLQQGQVAADGDPMEIYAIDNHDTDHEEEYVTMLQVKLKD